MVNRSRRKSQWFLLPLTEHITHESSHEVSTSHNQFSPASHSAQPIAMAMTS